MDTEDQGNAFEYSRSDDILMAIIVAGMIIGCILSQVFNFLVLPLMTSIGRIIGGLMLLLGLALCISWSALWSKEYKGQLITHGIYQYIRPHYMGAILLFLGVSIFFRSFISLLIAVYFAILIFRSIKVEEDHLLNQYGVAYREYMEKTKWRFIPLIY